MKTKLNRQLHGHMRPSIREQRGFFKTKKARSSFFWYLVGDAGAYFIIFFLIGKVIGTCLIYYVLVWPIIKGLFFSN